MNSIEAANRLHDDILGVLRQAQREAHQDGRRLERAQWIEAIKEAAPESYKRILLQRDVVADESPNKGLEPTAPAAGAEANVRG